MLQWKVIVGECFKPKEFDDYVRKLNLVLGVRNLSYYIILQNLDSLSGIVHLVTSGCKI